MQVSYKSKCTQRTFVLVKKKLLDTINLPEDLKSLQKEQLTQLALELRQFIIEIVATKEGHLGASLGVVELTIALHYTFNTPVDKIVWDVGHQAYAHKILTGRKDKFDTLRQYGGLSGFPKISESIYDAFGTGHSSTSISAVLGMALAAKLDNQYLNQHIAVIGDASIASGIAFEALNHAGITNTNIIVILNDNEMGIDPSVGALKKHLKKIKESKKEEQGNFFENLNFKYFGPIDGHNISEVIAILAYAKKLSGPKLIHLKTIKGKGLAQAEKNQIKYHAPGKFNAATGELINSSKSKNYPKYQEVFGKTLLDLAHSNNDIIAITPAMPTGSGLNYMMDIFPERTIDVGIAEQHAVTLAAGLATQKKIVFCSIYSTFLQRAYDQIIHDVALQNLPVIFCIDRAGIVGQDGPTHHGVFDIAFLKCIPNLIIYAPSNSEDLRNIMFTAQLGLNKPIAIRYPRGVTNVLNWKTTFKPLKIGQTECVKDGKNTAIITVGATLQFATEAINKSKQNYSIYNLGFIKPLDYKLLDKLIRKYKTIISLEDGCLQGGIGEEIKSYCYSNGFIGNFETLGIPDRFIPQGKTTVLNEDISLNTESILRLFSKYN